MAQINDNYDPFADTQQFRNPQYQPTTGPQSYQTQPVGTNNPETPIQYADASQTPVSTQPPPGWAPAPGAAPAAGTSLGPGRTLDDTQIQSWLSGIAGQPGVNPSVAGDPAYWTRRIKETGGLGSDNADYWLGLAKRPEGAPEGGGAAGTPGVRGVTGSAAYVPGQGVAGMGTVFGGGGLGDQANPLFDFLMQRAHQGVDVSANDPIIRQNVDAFNAQQQRSERDYESKLAERLGANTNMGKERRMGAEQIGSATSAFQAQMMAQERTARRQEVEQALQGSQGLLTQEQAMRLQEELAQLNLGENAYQFDVNDTFRNSPLYGG